MISSSESFLQTTCLSLLQRFVHWGEGAAGTATQGMGKERGTHELVICFCSICVHHSNALLLVDQCKRNVRGVVAVFVLPPLPFYCLFTILLLPQMSMIFGRQEFSGENIILSCCSCPSNLCFDPKPIYWIVVNLFEISSIDNLYDTRCFSVLNCGEYGAWFASYLCANLD